MLLQILDDGRLTDSKGRTVDFKNTVIIMTSNVGIGLTDKNIREALKEHFKPEFRKFERPGIRVMNEPQGFRSACTAADLFLCPIQDPRSIAAPPLVLGTKPSVKNVRSPVWGL